MDTAELKQAVLEAQAQIQMQAQQALAERMTEVCFKRCVTAPTDKLSDKQRRCLDQCTSAFIEGFGVAVRARGGSRAALPLCAHARESCNPAPTRASPAIQRPAAHAPRAPFGAAERDPREHRKKAGRRRRRRRALRRSSKRQQQHFRRATTRWRRTGVRGPPARAVV